MIHIINKILNNTRAIYRKNDNTISITSIILFELMISEINTYFKNKVSNYNENTASVYAFI